MKSIAGAQTSLRISGVLQGQGMKSVFCGTVLSVSLAMTMTPAGALPVMFEAHRGDLRASVKFDIAGSHLHVRLSNTSAADVYAPGEILTAVFFTIAGDPKLTPISAALPSDSYVLFGRTGPGRSVGGEWAYKNGLLSAPGDAGQGISSVGFGIFGPQELFPGCNLRGPTSPGGLQYGISSAGDDPFTGNRAVRWRNALVRSSVDFTLAGLPDEFDLSDISNVTFQYGTALSEPSLATVPEPGSLLLLGSGLMGLGALPWRRSNGARQ